jgi:hypothetical protein
MEKGNMEVQALPFYTIRKTRPPRLLGSLFIVIGLYGSDDWGMYGMYMVDDDDAVVDVDDDE